MNDARFGIVRLDLPDGRSVALQLTYAALDARGHQWMLDSFRAVQKGKPGSASALADLLEVLSGGAITAAEVNAAPAAAYPLGHAMKACWSAWEIAQYGPQGRPAEDGAENPPQSRRRTRWSTLFGRQRGRG